MAFGLTPVHAHAAVADRGDQPRVLVLGGATRGRDDGAGERDTMRGPGDAFAVRLPPRARAPPRAGPPVVAVAMRAVVGAVAELRQLRSALGEVQRGNRQLVQLVRRAERCDGVDRALRAPNVSVDISAAAPAPAAADCMPARATTSAAAAAESVGAHLVAAAGRFARAVTVAPAWAAPADAAGAAAASPARAEKAPGAAAASPDGAASIWSRESSVTSVQSFFDARDVAAPAPGPHLDLAAFDVADDDGVGASDATLARARDDALAWDAALGREWRDAVRPAYEAVEREAVAGLDARRLAAQVDRRRAAVSRGGAAARLAERCFAALEIAARDTATAAAAARDRVRAALAVDGGPSGGARPPTAALAASASFEDLRCTARAALERDGSAPASPAAGSRGAGAIENDDFEAAAAALAAHCARPRRAESARRHADAAVARLNDALRARTAAAAALCAGSLAGDTDAMGGDGDDYGSGDDGARAIDAAATARALAAADAWDADAALARAKVDARDATGAELAAIPRELDDALALKRRLLHAADRRCATARAAAAAVADVARRLGRRAARWAAWYAVAAAPTRGAALVAAAERASDAALALEDRRTDVASALDKATRRARTRARAASGDAALPPSPPARDLFAGSFEDLFGGAPAARAATAASRGSGAAAGDDVAALAATFADVEAELAVARRARRRAVAEAARCAYAEQPELAWGSRVIVDSIGRFKLLGDLGGTFDGGARAPATNRRAGGGGAWLAAPSRALAEFELAECDGTRGRAADAVDGATGARVLLVACALDERDDDAWAAHFREVDFWLAAPRHAAVAAPRSLVAAAWAPVAAFDESGGDDARDLAPAPMLHVEFPAYAGTLVGWAAATDPPRAPWHVQAVARQILTALQVLHAAGVAHGHVDPRAIVLLAGDPPNRAQLATRPLVAALDADAGTESAAVEPAAQFVAPEVAGGGTSAAADVYAFGAVLRWLRRATADAAAAAEAAAGGARAGAPAVGEDELRTLVARLLVADPRARPSAADVALHPYFTDSYVDRYVAGGDIVGVNAKLAAVRDLLAAVRSASRRARADLAVARGPGLADRVLAFFGRDTVAARRRGGGGDGGAVGVPPARRPLRVTFEGEAGVDEGGLAREMFALFFEGALAPAAGLFEDAGGEVLLPARLPRGEGAAARAARADRLEAFGRALVAALYEGCGAPPRLGPSLFKYLAHGAAHAAACAKINQCESLELRFLHRLPPATAARCATCRSSTRRSARRWSTCWRAPRPTTEAGASTLATCRRPTMMTTAAAAAPSPRRTSTRSSCSRSAARSSAAGATRSRRYGAASSPRSASSRPRRPRSSSSSRRLTGACCSARTTTASRPTASSTPSRSSTGPSAPSCPTRSSGASAPSKRTRSVASSSSRRDPRASRRRRASRSRSARSRGRRRCPSPTRVFSTSTSRTTPTKANSSRS